MFVRTYAGAIVGIDAVAVTVEVNIAGGGLGMYLVGLPDNAVKESEQRIRAAFENSGERMSGRKVVVSLAPADLRKALRSPCRSPWGYSRRWGAWMPGRSAGRCSRASCRSTGR